MRNLRCLFGHAGFPVTAHEDEAYVRVILLCVRCGRTHDVTSRSAWAKGITKVRIRGEELKITGELL